MLNFRLIFLAFVWIFSSSAWAADASSSTENALFTKPDTEILTPDQAFQLDIKADDQRTLKAKFTIAKGHYLYRNKITFESQDIRLETVLPTGDIKKDTHFGEVEVYHNAMTARLILNNPPANLQKIKVQASYQGCSEKGLCYSPIRKAFEINLPNEIGRAHV